MLLKTVAALLLSIGLVQAWFTCKDYEFCKKIRNNPPTSSYSIDENTIHASASSYEATLKNADIGEELTLKITALEHDNFHIQMFNPAKMRRMVHEALDENLKEIKFSKVSNTELINGKSTARITLEPQFRIEITSADGVNIMINDFNYLTYNEHTNDKSIAMDVSFKNVTAAYGLPEHAERLKLENTADKNPYRMKNVDYAAYGYESQEAVYGAIPLVYAHGATTSGVFWLNGAQTYVDVNVNENKMLSTVFISESGLIDFFILVGPTMKDVARQYVNITGKAPLPQMFTLGYHQSRYSYMTQNELEDVVEKLDANDFPLDVMWLDIDYTDGKRYFTWNYTSFPQPVAMQNKLNQDGRKLVVILDPHIFVDEDYFVYSEGRKGGYFVRNPDGSSIYEGECWPGISSYIDFLNPEARKWYGGLYSYEKFANTTPIVHIWNDMNEPSVFHVDENAMPPDVLQYEDVEYRDVQNMYGFLQTKATFEGMLARDNHKQRPFILTRSHFAGSQRYAGIWTGDNVADWSNMSMSIPMCLTEALGGMSFCGADVGGFMGNATEELLQRWFQLGSWLPFFREHSTNGTAYREPYVYSKPVQKRLRNAVRERYTHLPYWYTLFYENERFGDPVIRPLVYAYPDDKEVQSMDTQFLVGDNIMVAPILKSNATIHEWYVPGHNDWSNSRDGWLEREVNIDTVTPVFYRRGSIIPVKTYERNSTYHMRNDPYELRIHLDANLKAVGRLYIDDTESYDYRTKNAYHYMEYTFSVDTIDIVKIDSDAHYDQEILIESLVIFYHPSIDAKSDYDLQYNANEKAYKISNLNIRADQEGSTRIFLNNL